jgi:hypothetical protein
MTHLCPRTKPQGLLDKVSAKHAESPVNLQFFSSLQVSEGGTLFRNEIVKRKAKEVDEEENTDEMKVRCLCPICGAMVLQEEINPHLDACLSRSAVLKLVREGSDPGGGVKTTSASQKRRR